MFTDNGILKDIIGSRQPIEEAIRFYDDLNVPYTYIYLCKEQKGIALYVCNCMAHKENMFVNGSMKYTFRKTMETIAKDPNFHCFITNQKFTWF